MKNFLDNSLDFEQSENVFSLLYEEVRKEIDMFKIDLEQIDKFEPSTRSYRFASFIGSIYREFDDVEDDYCTEQDSIKEAIVSTYLNIKKLIQFRLKKFTIKLTFNGEFYCLFNSLTCSNGTSPERTVVFAIVTNGTAP